ncbi:hypothetical protein BC939DRAFT_504223 [Gamsiella multidivaricata]|uniref:uncharacterized protein n=1 Tax=Gamsiella multidivaricata TaxID=101098 RepID=UPI00221FE039|nr:uncharacterized protein BC939DRAFT_504223 [Gamsiella multidivaricata]KAI7821694.1 hypothetical protein BC939DRAFT_504223 [Gamsiella multidivaricata]
MLRTAAPGSSSISRQSTSGKRTSPSASLSSAESSPSSLSTKEQKLQQLQALQRQQQQHLKLQRQQQLDTPRMYADRYEKAQGAGTAVDQRQHEPMWASQETRDAWINVADAVGGTRPSGHWERRHSHLSDKNMNLGPMKLLSDETPPDDMDGSWGLDDLDDDNNNNKHHQHDTRNHPAFNEQNDSEITKNNNDNKPATTINNDSRNMNVHGNVHMGKNEKMPSPNPASRSRSRQFQQDMERNTNSPLRSRSQTTVQDINGGSRGFLGDVDQHSSSSFLSTHIRKSPPVSRKNSSALKYPWRDSKHETIFTDLADEHAQLRLSRDHDALSTTPRPQASTGKGNQQHSRASDEDTSSSLSLSDIIDAVNKGEDSIDPARSSKYEQARRRLAQLSPDRNLQEDGLDDLPSSVTGSPGAMAFQNNQEAFKQQRLMRVIKAAMNIDLNDNRSHAPSDDAKDASSLLTANANLQIKTAVTTSRSQSNIPVSSHSSRFSYGSRHRSQGSRDTEIGDRGSTTSRDSVYRDSLSGSTLGSAGFHAQLEGFNKHEMVNAFTALKTAAVAQLLSSDVDPKNTTRILPRNVNTKSQSHTNVQQQEVQSAPQQPVLETIIPEDTDPTPHPKDRVNVSSARGIDGHHRRFRPETDPLRAKQYAALANKRLSKQTSSFVEELATATALKSAMDSSIRNTPSSASKQSEQQLTVEDDVSDRILEYHGNINHDDEFSKTEKRDATFKKVSREEDKEEADENSDAELDDLGSLIGSKGMEDAFRGLESLDMSFDTMAGAKCDQDVARRTQTDDEGAGEYLSAVSLPSKPKRKGEYSLKWEDQVDTVSNADTSRLGINASMTRSSSNAGVHDTSGLFAEQASFSHAKGHLLRFITGLHPWDEWDQVKTLDLSKREVESTIKLDHLVPNLEVLLLNENQVSYLTGVPISVKTLQARSNQLSDLTNFSHLINLQYLDISHNEIEDLTGLSSLVHLRELIAEDNKIKSVSALQQMDGLIRLDVSHNCLTSLDFRWSKLTRLEFLNASYNKIEQLENLESLTGLIHANLAHNCIEDISLVQQLRRLRILRLSENKLVTFDATPFPGLRTLYLDDNRLQSLENCQKLTRLENFSVRDQEGEGIAIDMTEFVNSRKLYLSGNPIHALDFDMGFYRLEYLEVCAGCLSELPLEFATLFPNLRGLNLSYNGLDSISALDGLHRLRRLIFVGNNLKSFSDILSLLKRMRSLVTLDLRHNPLTSNMYPVMSVGQGSKYQDTYRTNQNSETELDWRRRDIGFRRALPDAKYVKRSVYRSAIIKSCKRLEWFDGGVIQTKERERAPIVLGDMLDNYGRNYLVNNRREDEEEDLEFEEGHEGYYTTEEYVNPQQDADWLYNREQLEQLAQEQHFQNGEMDAGEDFDHDGRDPEDITDNSRRPGSSVESGSLSGRRQQQQQSRPQSLALKSTLTRFSGTTQQQPRRLHSSSGYQMVSPSPKGPVSLSRTSSNAMRVKPNRMSSSSTLSHNQLQQQFQQQQRQQDEAEDVHYEGSPDKRSAVRSWRDEVNEISHRKQHSPRVHPSSVSSAAIVQDAQSKSQQLRRGEKGNADSSRNGSSTSGARNETTNINAAHEISTIAVANNSGENENETLYQSQIRPPLRRRASTIGARKFCIPAPPLFQYQSQQQQQQHRLSTHSRGRSDATSGPMSPATGLNRQHVQQPGRPASQHGVLGYDNGEFGASSLHQSQHQLSMSPMGGPSAMTASGTVLRPAHHRRRSFAVYPSGSANARRKELLGFDQQLQNSPGRHATAPMMSMSASAHMLTQSPMASPGYFGITHHGTQSPFGFSKGAMTPGGGRSLPNTPSRNGRASRVSLGAGSHHYPQTLARDMELSEMAS